VNIAATDEGNVHMLAHNADADQKEQFLASARPWRGVKGPEPDESRSRAIVDPLGKHAGDLPSAVRVRCRTPGQHELASCWEQDLTVRLWSAEPNKTSITPSLILILSASEVADV
jgi:hypothetical protein